MTFKEIYRTLELTIRFFTAKRVMTQASALTYSSLLAIVQNRVQITHQDEGYFYLTLDGFQLGKERFKTHDMYILKVRVRRWCKRPPASG